MDTMLHDLFWGTAAVIGGAVGALGGLFLVGVVGGLVVIFGWKLMTRALGSVLRAAWAAPRRRGTFPTPAVQAILDEAARRRAHLGKKKAVPTQATPAVPFTIPGVDLYGTGPDEKTILGRRR